MRIRIPFAVMAVALTAGLVTGCAAPSDSPATTAPSPTAETAETPAGDGADAEGDEATDVAPQGLGEPIATETMPAMLASDADATVAVTTYALQQSGDVITLTVGIELTSSQTDAVTLREAIGSPWTPYLVDTVNLNKHNPMTRPDSDLTQVRATGTTYLSATFAAPPADVTAMDVVPFNGAPAIVGAELP